MIRHQILLAFLLLAVPAAAQEAYSVPATAGQVVDLAAIVAADNERTCSRLGQVDGCTQAQACVAAGLASGCTAAQARAAEARIYQATQAGREEYVLHAIVAPEFRERKTALAPHHRERFCRWFASAATQTQKDTACTNAGRPAGCELCP